MGDTSTHEQISAEIIPILREARPDEKLDYFELGNWLTDLSQFRDPTAMVGAKTSIFEQKTTWYTRPLAEVAQGFQSYLDDLMGLPGPQGGLLAAWFRDITLAATIEKFKPVPIAPARIEDLYGKLFTQYYPHEHMDFPPWPRHDIIGDRSPSQWAHHDCAKPPTKGSGRKLYQYQEEQLEYISELLTVIEQKWALQPDPSNADPDRQAVLTRFGHASHAIEDFFFHSNFVETAWESLARPLSSAAPADESGDSDHDDHEEPGPRNETRERRRFFRRLRAPMGSGDDVDTQDSAEMREVYTGFFGGKDIFHTFMDAFHGIKQKGGPGAELMEHVLHDPGGETPEEREKNEARHMAEHKERLFNGTYEVGMQGMVASKKCDQKTYEAFHRACEMDRALWTKYSKIDLGISGFFISILRAAREESKVARAAVERMDAAGIVSSIATDNGASNETIGSHSLMSKDSERKHPLRKEAFHIASTVGQYVGKRMAQQLRAVVPVSRSVNLPPAAADGGASNALDFRSIDWLHLLQHFVAHPGEAEFATSAPVAWWQPQLDAVDSDELGHRLRFLDRATVEERLKEKKKKELEKKYDDLAVEAETEWKKAKGSATGTLVGAAIGLVAGAIAGAIIGGMVGGPVGAILGGIIGAIGGAVLGGLLGSLVGGLLGGL